MILPPLAKLGAIAVASAALAGSAIIGVTCACVIPSGGGSGGGGGAGVATANLWITAPGDTAGSCSRSGSLVAYSAGISCGATQFLDQAVSAASLSDIIGIPGGTYNGAAKQIVNFESRLQNLSPGCDPTGYWGTATTANCIRLAPKQGESIVWPFPIEIHAGALWFDGTPTGTNGAPRSRTFNWRELGLFDTESDSSSNYPDHITMTGYKVSDLVIYGSHNVRFSNGNVGDVIHDGTAANCAGNPFYPGAHNSLGESFTAFETEVGGRNSVIDSNIVIDHTYLHNVNTAADPACDPHDGGLFIHTGVNGLTLENNVWEQEWVYDIQIQNQGDGPPSQNVTIQNNWFGTGVLSIRDTGNQTTPGQRGLQWDSGTWTNWLVRYNSFDEQGSTLCATGTDCAYSNVRFIGNVGAIPTSGTGQPCGAPGITFDKNVWEGGTCGAGDSSMSTPLYVSSTIGAADFHLVNGSVTPNNIVTPITSDYALATDIDDAARSAPRDAGSDER